MTSFHTPKDRWLSAALGRIEADFQRSADTHLIALPLPEFSARGIDFICKCLFQIVFQVAVLERTDTFYY